MAFSATINEFNGIKLTLKEHQHAAAQELINVASAALKRIVIDTVRDSCKEFSGFLLKISRLE
eukprot:7360795-Karenia_brevis.AAC.1